ncbi:MAG TPA: tail fiber domain-containing protein, partial [Actinomycetota bacterium]|nr:tail fiber domain-containing protein [Actinomycetota bacterium]
LMGMGQVTTPQFQPFSRQGVNAAPVGQYMSDAYKNQVASASATNQGLFGLGGAGITALFGASDRRLKEDIEPTGGELAGAPLYWFRYRGQPDLHVGVMADEVRPLHPDAVVEIGGYDAVNYGLLYSRGNDHG